LTLGDGFVRLSDGQKLVSLDGSSRHCCCAATGRRVRSVGIARTHKQSLARTESLPAGTGTAAMVIGIGDITDTTTVTIGTGIGGIITIITIGAGRATAIPTGIDVVTDIATEMKGVTLIDTGIAPIGGIAA
jgi:hypothetical protein